MMTAADCWGLIELMFRQEAGIELPKYPEAGVLGWHNGDDKVAIAEAIKRHAGERPWVRLEDDAKHKLWDVLWLRSAGRTAHTALVVAKGVVIHTDDNLGESCLAKYRHVNFAYKLVGTYRHEAFINA